MGHPVCSNLGFLRIGSEIPCVSTTVDAAINLAHGLCRVKGTALAVPMLFVQESGFSR
jgi:hypothetical protein